MFENVSVSVFPEGDDWSDRIGEYLEVAASCGCGGVFSSAHLPERPFGEQVRNTGKLASMAAGTGMELTVDISGHELKTILADPELSRAVENAPISFLRLDYAMTRDLLREAHGRLGVRGVVLNASVLTKAEIEGWITFFHSLGGISLKACHNFYPRPETGMTLPFMLEKSRLYKKYGIEVACCIASLAEARGPLKQGLPSVEEHRYRTPLRAAAELALYDEIDEVLFGDSFVPEKDLRDVAGIRGGRPFPVPVVPSADASREELELLFGLTHRARPDAAAFSIRSQASREMAQFGRNMTPRGGEVRPPGTVTVDNVLYGRYSGELQIVTETLPPDERVNVVARLRGEDLWRLPCLRPGSEFVFVKAE